MPRVVTIDGPAGAGKSTVARRLADRLGWRFLDTGAMYRAVTLAALRSGTDLSSDQALGELAARLTVSCSRAKVLLDQRRRHDGHPQRRGDQGFPVRGRQPGVRRRLVGLAAGLRRLGDTVTEGRDQGTIVFPDAFRKFFLTADEEERARRRLADHQARGEDGQLRVGARRSAQSRRARRRPRHRPHEARRRRRADRYHRHVRRSGGRGTGRTNHRRAVESERVGLERGACARFRSHLRELHPP